MKLAFCVLFSFLSISAQTPEDRDADGIPDQLEQQLLEKFLPTLILSKGECDGLPAEFIPHQTEPVAKAKNGTLYGRVSPFIWRGSSDVFLEIHYYHLWTQDCGSLSHELDAEHVSVLISASSMDVDPDEWKAIYWYAAAHEDTLCDFSQAMKSSALNAEDRGARIWVSRGKHASFLKPELCARGCGGDSCQPDRILIAPQVINLGEGTYLLNGAEWVRSPRWPLVSKLTTDFSDSLLIRLSLVQEEEAVLLAGPRQSVQAVAFATGASASALSIAGSSTDSSLNLASQKTDNALQRTAESTEEALKKSALKVKRSLKRSLKSATSWMNN